MSLVSFHRTASEEPLLVFGNAVVAVKSSLVVLGH